MGLERIVSVVQGVQANYETDLFMPIIRRILQLTGMTQDDRARRDIGALPRHRRPHARRHLPDRRRRASRRQRIATTSAAWSSAARRASGGASASSEPFLADVADAVIETMGGHYHELVERREAIRKAITQEEVRFRRTLDRGLAELDTLLGKLTPGGVLSGADAFFLKSSLGLPFEVTRDIAQEKGYTVDEKGFLKARSMSTASPAAAGRRWAPSNRTSCTTACCANCRRLARSARTASPTTRTAAWSVTCACWPSSAMASSCPTRASAIASRWCWTTRPSTSRRAARSAIPA